MPASTDPEFINNIYLMFTELRKKFHSRLRVFMESSIFVEIFAAVSSLTFVNGVFPATIPLHDADEDQDQK